MMHLSYSVQHTVVANVGGHWFEFKLVFCSYLKKDDHNRWWPIGQPWVEYRGSKELPLYDPLDEQGFPP